MKLRIAIITVLLILAPQAAFALVPGPPAIFMDASPKTQDVSAGGSVEFKISVYPQGEWREGSVSFELVDPPEGVTAVFVPDTVEFVDMVEVLMTVDVATGAVQGNVTLKVVASGLAYSLGNKEFNVGSDVKVKLIVSEPDEPEQVKTVTITVTITSISFRSISTTTVVSSVTSTVTDVITTRTPTIATSTTVEQLSQASDLAFPAVAVGVVAVLLSVAFVALRRKS